MLFKTLFFLNTEKIGYTKAEKWLCYTLHSIGFVPVVGFCTEAKRTGNTTRTSGQRRPGSGPGGRSRRRNTNSVGGTEPRDLKSNSEVPFCT